MVILCRNYWQCGKKQNYSQQPHCFKRSADVTSSSCYRWWELAREMWKKPYSTSCWCVSQCCWTFWKRVNFVFRVKEGGGISAILKFTYWHTQNIFLIWNNFFSNFFPKCLSILWDLTGNWLKQKWNILFHKTCFYFFLRNFWRKLNLRGRRESVFFRRQQHFELWEMHPPSLSQATSFPNWVGHFSNAAKSLITSPLPKMRSL